MKFIPAATLLFALFCFSCKKSNTTTTTTGQTSVTANIDSIKGYYHGTTTGDSIYYYSDSAGIVQYAVRSFSNIDTLIVTSADTTSISVASKYYSVTFPYLYYYTGSDSVTVLIYQAHGDGGNITKSVVLVDSANNVNHININYSGGHNKRFTSTFALYKR